MVEIDLHEVPLTSLSSEAKDHLSCLLKTNKVLLSDGPEKLPRYWKGLACLLGISTEEALSYERDQTARVLQYWIDKNDGTATVGQLLEYIQRIDRYDVFDDLMEYAGNGKLIGNVHQRVPQNNQLAVHIPNNQVVPVPEDTSAGSLITFDDKIHGSPQCYHAYVLYAKEDRDFVDELLMTMRKRGFKLVTEEDLLPEFSTTYAPVANLISSARIYKIILIYSPAFLQSPANTFYMNYAQAVGIEMRRPKIVPVMLHECILPAQLTFYHKLYVQHRGTKPSYHFYDRLAYSLAVTRSQSSATTNGCSASLSTLNITEVSISSDQGYSTTNVNGLLALPSGTIKSQSMNGLNEHGSISQMNNQMAHDIRSLTRKKFKNKKSKQSKNPFKMLWTSVVQLASTKN